MRIRHESRLYSMFVFEIRRTRLINKGDEMSIRTSVIPALICVVSATIAQSVCADGTLNPIGSQPSGVFDEGVSGSWIKNKETQQLFVSGADASMPNAANVTIPNAESAARKETMEIGLENGLRQNSVNVAGMDLSPDYNDTVVTGAPPDTGLSKVADSAAQDGEKTASFAPFKPLNTAPEDLLNPQP